MSHSFFWFDFETFGVNPSQDRPSQFAGIRTDYDFNIIDEPVNLFCQPANDFLPHPEACLVTGITPQQALEKGVPENEFFKHIHLELSTANTCAVGYNNIRFDDEVLRFGLYRNFYDAYAREWQNGNSRWDILDMMRMTYALRPEGINWPLDENGKPSFRLEILSKANNIEHTNAHDALADVYATIAMAHLVKQKQPRLFEYLFELRDKRRVMAEIDLINLTPFVHCSGMLGSAHDYCAVMLPLIAHPTNKNSAICLDLTKPLVDLNTLTADEISTRIFTKQDELPEDVQRVAIKEVHYNKCPAVAPIGVLNEQSQRRLNINLQNCLDNAEIIKSNIASIRGKLISVFQARNFEPISDPDRALYSGGFFQTNDKNLMQQIRKSDFQSLATSEFPFQDNRLAEMLFRYRARNALHSLNSQELIKWNNYRQANFFDPDAKATLRFPDLIEKLSILRQDKNNDSKILDQVEAYAKDLVNDFLSRH